MGDRTGRDGLVRQRYRSIQIITPHGVVRGVDNAVVVVVTGEQWRRKERRPKDLAKTTRDDREAEGAVVFRGEREVLAGADILRRAAARITERRGRDQVERRPNGGG